MSYGGAFDGGEVGPESIRYECELVSDFQDDWGRGGVGFRWMDLMGGDVE